MSRAAPPKPEPTETVTISYADTPLKSLTVSSPQGKAQLWQGRAHLYDGQGHLLNETYPEDVEALAKAIREHAAPARNLPELFGQLRMSLHRLLPHRQNISPIPFVPPAAPPVVTATYEVPKELLATLIPPPTPTIQPVLQAQAIDAPQRRV